MVKAIIFDCFGVLATEGWLPFKAKYFSDDPERFEQATDLIKQANRGLASYDDFINSVARLAAISPDQAYAEIRSNVPDEQMFEYIKALKPRYKIGFLSNIGANYLNQIFSEDQLALFDAVALSYETGAIKPQAEAYEDAARRLGIELNEAILVDDQERNVIGAQAVGMKAILYHDMAQLKLDLKPLLA